MPAENNIQPSEQAKSWYPDTNDWDIILEFTLRFSRLEYAMKCTGFSKMEYGSLHPDWKAFQITLVQNEVPPCANEALKYLKQKPPQIQKENKVWEEINKGNGWPFLIKAVKTVRNNLFHGGKTPFYPRDKTLLTHCLSVIKAIVEVAPSEVRDTYNKSN